MITPAHVVEDAQIAVNCRLRSTLPDTATTTTTTKTNAPAQLEMTHSRGCIKNKSHAFSSQEHRENIGHYKLSQRMGKLTVDQATMFYV